MAFISVQLAAHWITIDSRSQRLFNPTHYERINNITCILSITVQLISIRPGPYTVAAATASLVAKFPVPLTKAAIVSPFAKPASNGKSALKCVTPPENVASEIRTVTGRSGPDRYTIAFWSQSTCPATEYSSVMFFGSGLVTTFSVPKVVSGISESGFGQEPGTMNICSAVNAKLGEPPVRRGAAEGTFPCA